jgi:TolB-like protein/Tfp pilus assembly protein PilF
LPDSGGLKGWLRGPVGPSEKVKKAPSRLDRRRIAVLPFSNMSPDTNDEYFADGLTEELIATISKIREVSVVSRTSVMQYRKNPKPIRDVAEELQTGTILEGSVRKSGNKVRVTIQLVDAAQDKHEWSESYDRGLEDIFAIQSDISQNVAEVLKIQLFANEKKRMQNIPTSSIDAFTAYLKGRKQLNERTEQGFQAAIRHFEEAIRLDPKYAAAYAGLADYYYLLENWSLMSPKDAFPKALEYAVRALELDDGLAEAHVSMAMCLANMKRDWKGAEREYRRALDLNPSYATGHHWYAFTLLQLQRRWDEAIREITAATKLDPFSQIIALNKAKILFWAGRRDEAMVQFRLALDLNPDSAFARAELGMAMVYNSSIDEGTAEIEKALNRDHQGPISAKLRLALAYGMANRKTEAENLLREAKEVPSGTYVPGTIIAMIYAVLGEKDLAFESLNRAVRDGTSTIVVLSEQVFDALRTDPRFHQILEKIGLP